MSNYKKGDIVSCQVSGIEDYGFFVNTKDGYTGLVHISEISDLFVKNVKDYVELNEDIFAKIIDIDEKKKNLKLSIKNINYKIDGNENIGDKNGFKSLKEMLPKWIEEAQKKNS